MELVWIIYLIDVVDSVKGFSALAVGLMLVLGLAVFAVSLFFALEDKPEKITPALKTMRAGKITLWCLIVIFLCKLIPSQDTAYKMLAAYGVSEISQNDDVKKLAGKSLQVIEKAMDKYIKDSEGVAKD